MLRASEGERDPLTGAMVPMDRLMLAHRSADASVTERGAGDVLRVLRICARSVRPVLRRYPLRNVPRGADKRDRARVSPIGGYRIGAGMGAGTHGSESRLPLPLVKAFPLARDDYYILT
jgi:hypothetical protein